MLNEKQKLLLIKYGGTVERYNLLNPAEQAECRALMDQFNEQLEEIETRAMEMDAEINQLRGKVSVIQDDPSMTSKITKKESKPKKNIEMEALLYGY